MKKDLILITSFAPDTNRQQLLRNLVHNINKDNFDIMISSHSSIPSDIVEKSDYVIYEKNNDLDFNVDNKFYFYYHNTNFSIITTEIKKYSHFIPCIRLISSGLLYARSLGYNVAHYIEYDSLIEDDTELIENSKLLEEHSAIYYQLQHLSYPNSPISFNLNKISENWFSLDKKNYENFLTKPNSSKIIEEYEWILLNESEGLFKKQRSDLKEKKIYVALSDDLEDNKWIVPFYDSVNNSMSIFSWVEHDSEVNSEVLIILNNQKVIQMNRSFKSLWSIYNLGDINDVKQIKIIVNGVVRRDYNFNEQDINIFIKHNYIKRK